MTDDLAVYGEDEGYVPCDEEAAATSSPDADALAVVGEDEGFVPDGTGASAEPADASDEVAIFGHSVGFVAKPCTEAVCPVFDDFNRVEGSGFGVTSSSALRAYTETIIGLNISATVDGTSGVVTWAPHRAPEALSDLVWVYEETGELVESLAGGGPWQLDEFVFTARIFVPQVSTNIDHEVFAGTVLSINSSFAFGNGFIEIGVSNHDDTLRYIGIHAGGNNATSPWPGDPGWYIVTWEHHSGAASDVLILTPEVGAPATISCASAPPGTFGLHFATFDFFVQGSLHASGSGAPPASIPLDPMGWYIDWYDFVPCHMVGGVPTYGE